MGGETRFKPTHGKRNTPEYRVWQDMLNRCRNPNVRSYKNYGGRGISVCEEWLDFETFFTDMGERPEGYSLERVDVNGDYTPENCTWVPLAEQQSNRRNSHMVTYNGKTLHLAAWARILGVKYATLSKRLNRYGWSVERAFTE
jgi:hypothetical protein